MARGRGKPGNRALDALGTFRSLVLSLAVERADTASIPVGAVEVEAHGAVGLDVAKLEEVDRGELEQPHLPHERLQEPLCNEDDSRWPPRLARGGDELSQRLWIVEAPGVSFECPQQHRVVGRETERDQHGRVRGVERDELDAGPPEIQIRSDDLELGFDRVDVLRDQRAELLEILDFAPLEGQLHASLSRRDLTQLMCQPRADRLPLTNPDCCGKMREAARPAGATLTRQESTAGHAVTGMLVRAENI